MSSKLLNELVITLRWMDMDAYGHLGNSRYFDFMTDARVALLEQVGVTLDYSLQYVAAKAECEFKAPCVYPGKLVVQQFIERVGNSSFELSYRFFMQDSPEVICAQGKIVMVCYDAKQKRPVRLSEEVRKLLTL